MVEARVVSVYVISYHSQVEKFLVGLLFFCRVSKGSVEPGLELSPQGLVCLCDISGGQEFSFQLVLLFFRPIVDLWSPDE